jgi:hypothetical protein
MFTNATLLPTDAVIDTLRDLKLIDNNPEV